MKITNMEPMPVPEVVKEARPHGLVRPIGPPRGFSGDEVDTVESIYTVEQIDHKSVPCYRDYWKPTEQQLRQLNNGGFIELAQYNQFMIMHGIQVWGDDS